MAAYGDVLDALGDPTRRAVFELVARRPQAVGELARQLPISRPAVSQHLRALKAAQLVCDRAQGTRRIYQLDTGGIEAVRAYFDRFWDEALAAFAAAANDDRTADTGEDTRHDSRQDSTEDSTEDTERRR